MDHGEQGFIINDDLGDPLPARRTGLDRFKAKILARFGSDLRSGLLLDIGSGSGRFLYQNGARYQTAMGIEITPEVLAYSRTTLGLNVVESINDVPEGVSVATAWHSLEHIPERSLLKLLDVLARKMVAGGRLLVSVPNGASWQYRWFGDAFAYFDVPNHLHQFSPQSLARVLDHAGFRHVSTTNSWPYNTFGWTQALLNVATGTHNYLYYRLKRRSRKPSPILDVANLMLLAAFVPAGWLLAAAEAMNLKSQGVITACFEKSPC